jgi:hypothetical protein
MKSGIEAWIFMWTYKEYVFTASLIIVSLVYYFDKKNKEKDS